MHRIKSYGQNKIGCRILAISFVFLALLRPKWPFQWRNLWFVQDFVSFLGPNFSSLCEPRFPKTGSKVLHGGSFLSATGTILRCLFRGRYCYTPSGNSCWLELLHWNFCNFCNWTRGGVRLVVDVGRLPTLVTLLAQDRYYDADFLLGWVEVKVGGSMITICVILDFTRSGRAACLNGGTYLYRHPVPLT